MIGKMGMNLEVRKQLKVYCNGKRGIKLTGTDLVQRKR